MHRTAESGVAAHWLYKDGEANLSDLQQRTHAWLQSLLDIQQQTGDSAEFLEHVKVDLFPDSVYVFTPKSKIIALPRGARHRLRLQRSTPASATRRCRSPSTTNRPLRTELRNGDIVEIMTADLAPSPTGCRSCAPARRARRSATTCARSTRSNRKRGRALLSQALHTLGIEPGPAAPGGAPAQRIERQVLDELYADIGIGKRMAALVARHITT
jgi:GTP pyrophosphokinase